MDACHVLLRRQRMSELKVIYTRQNTYEFPWGKGMIELLPTKGEEKQKRNINIMFTENEIEMLQEIKKVKESLILPTKPELAQAMMSQSCYGLCLKNKDTAPKELPLFEFIPGAKVPNLPYYRICPGEHMILQEQVEHLLKKV